MERGTARSRPDRSVGQAIEETDKNAQKPGEQLHIYDFVYVYSHRPKSALERGSTRSRPGSSVGQAIEETDENAPEPEEEPVKKEEPVEPEVNIVTVCFIMQLGISYVCFCFLFKFA